MRIKVYFRISVPAVGVFGGHLQLYRRWQIMHITVYFKIAVPAVVVFGGHLQL